MSEPTLQDPSAAVPPPPEPPRRTVPWSFGDSILVLAIWLVAIVFIGGAILIGLQRIFAETQSQALTLPLTALMLIAVTAGYVRLRYPGSARLLLGFEPPSARALGFGLLGGVVAFGVFAFGLGNLLEFIAQSVGSDLPEVQEGFRDLAADRRTAPALVFGSVIVAPIAEELFYRGMLFAALRRRLDLWPAMGISGALFGLSHLQTSLEGYLLVLLIIIPLGMFLAWLYERRNSIVVPIVAHATFNLVQVLLLIRQS